MPQALRGGALLAPRLPLGVCNHSLRSLELSAHGLIHYAIEQRLDAVLFNTLGAFEQVAPDYLLSLRKQAESGAVRLYVGVGSISARSTQFSRRHGEPEALLRKGIQVASLLGSPVVGVRIGSIVDRYAEGGIAAHVEEVVNLMTSLRAEALAAGVKFAFENHMGDLRSEELLGLIRATGEDICGALFDPANAVWAMEDPLQALRTLGGTVLCTSLRDVQLWETNEGASFQGMAVGEGVLDVPRLTGILAAACPGVPLQVETISNSARIIPFLKPGFWDGFPGLTAAALADFLRLAKTGSPQRIVSHGELGMSRRAFERQLQQAELAKSIDYLRAYGHAGLKP